MIELLKNSLISWMYFSLGLVFFGSSLRPLYSDESSFVKALHRCDFIAISSLLKKDRSLSELPITVECGVNGCKDVDPYTFLVQLNKEIDRKLKSTPDTQTLKVFRKNCSQSQSLSPSLSKTAKALLISGCITIRLFRQTSINTQP